MTVTNASGAGRPPITSRAELAAVAIDLFSEHGFESTSADDIAAAAGVSRRTFFRYFPTKAAVLWAEFDEEVEQVRALLAAAEATTPMFEAVRAAVLATNDSRRSGRRQLLARMKLINTEPALQASAALHYAGWVRVVGDFVAQRTGVPSGSLFPETVGRCVLAAALAAYDGWVTGSERSLGTYLDQAFGALADGFDERRLADRAARAASTRRRPRA